MLLYWCNRKQWARVGRWNKSCTFVLKERLKEWKGPSRINEDDKQMQPTDAHNNKAEKGE